MNKRLSPSNLIEGAAWALNIVESVGLGGCASTAENIAESVDLDIRAVRALVRELCLREYLVQWDDRYTLGPALVDRVHELAVQLSVRNTAAQVSLPVLAGQLRRSRLWTQAVLGHGADARAGACPCREPPARNPDSGADDDVRLSTA